MPAGGAEQRSRQMATLARLRHELLAPTSSAGCSTTRGGRGRGAGRRLRRGLPGADRAPGVEKARRVPAELRAEMTRQGLAGRARLGRRQGATPTSPRFLPHLERNVELRRRYAECFEGFEGFEHPYDPLLDDFEPGHDDRRMRAPCWTSCATASRPLIERDRPRGDAVDDACLHGDFDRRRAARASRARSCSSAAAARGGAGASTRPRIRSPPRSRPPTSGSRRATTPATSATALWSVIHEAGHGLYESGIAPELRAVAALPPAVARASTSPRAACGRTGSGRGAPFLERLLPAASRASSPSSSPASTPEALYRAAEQGRAVADPRRGRRGHLQPPHRAALRARAASSSRDGSSSRDLPEAWNARIAEYLGLEVPDDAARRAAGRPLGRRARSATSPPTRSAT